MDRYGKIRVLGIGLCVFFVIWGILDIVLKRYDLVADRLMIASISILVVMLSKAIRISNTSIIAGLVPIMLHSLGRYELVWFGLPYDHYLHFSAGLAISLILYDYLRQKYDVIPAAIFSVCITAGIGSFMEILEFTGYFFGGSGDGILFYGAGDIGEWSNAIRDMIMNTIGAITAVVVKR